MTSYELHAAKSIWKHGSRRCFSKFLMQSILCRHSSKTIVVWYTVVLAVRGGDRQGESMWRMFVAENNLLPQTFQLSQAHGVSFLGLSCARTGAGLYDPCGSLLSQDIVWFCGSAASCLAALGSPASQRDGLAAASPSVTCPSPGTHILAHPAMFEIAHSHLPGA